MKTLIIDPTAHNILWEGALDFIPPQKTILVFRVKTSNSVCGAHYYLVQNSLLSFEVDNEMSLTVWVKKKGE